MQRHWVFASALALSAAGVVACSGDDTNTPVPTSSDAGSDATTPLKDASVPTDGSAADTGSSDAGNPKDSGAEDTGAEDAGDAATPAYALFVATDYVSAAELAVVDVEHGSLAGNLTFTDQDSVPYVSGSDGFVMEEAIGDVVSLSPSQPWLARATIDTNDTADAGSYASNPHAVVVTTGTKAYVARYSSNVVKIFDVATGVSKGSIDLTPFLEANSPDGLVDVTDGAYDPSTKRAYLLLQRINQYAFGPAPDYLAACLPWSALLVAIDTTTDLPISITDAGINGAIELVGANPQALTPDFAHGKILVADTGCDEYPDGGADDAGPTAREGRGVEAVDLTSATSSFVYQAGTTDRLGGILVVDSTHGYINFSSGWYTWDVGATVGTTPIADFPQAAFYDGNGHVLGVATTAPAAGSDAGTTWSVVSLATATGTVSTVLPSPFKTVVPAAVSGAFLP